MDASSLILVGKIGAPWGVKGFARVHSFTQPSTNLAKFTEWHVCHQGKWKVQPVESSQCHAKGLVVKLTGVETRDDAELLTHAEVYVKREQFTQPKKNTFYWVDLIGMQVFNQNGDDYGILTSLYETGAHDNMIIDREGQPSLHIPFLFDVFVLSVDLQTRKIVVDWSLSA